MDYRDPITGRFRLLDVVAALVFSTALIVTGCSSPPELTDAEDGSAATEIFLVDAAELSRNGTPSQKPLTRYQELSVLGNLAVGCQFRSLTAGKNYSFDITVKDAKGKPIAHQPKPVTMTAKGTEEDVIVAPLAINPTSDAPGKWKVNVAIRGVGETTGKVVLLPPSSTERVVLAQHEKAREYAFRAFASYWVAITENPLTFMTGVDPETSNTARPNAQSSFGASFSSKPSAPAQTQSSFFQISGLRYHFVKDHVSDADKLNGISYRGRSAFTFFAHRSYDPEKGWTKWQDVSRDHSDITAAISDFGSAVFEAASAVESKRVLFYSAPLVPTLRYEVYCQDDNWFVISDEQDFFVNGMGRGKKKPELLEIQSPTLVANNQLFQPTQEAAQYVIANGRDPRKVAQQLGESVRADPEAAKSQVARTMTLLRGRTLE